MEICVIARWLILHYGQFLKAQKKGQRIAWHLFRPFVQVERIPTVGCWDIGENMGSPLGIGGNKKCDISRNSTFCSQTHLSRVLGAIPRKWVWDDWDNQLRKRYRYVLTPLGHVRGYGGHLRIPFLPEAPIPSTHPLRLPDKAIWTVKIEKIHNEMG